MADPTIRERLRELAEKATDAPWQWLDSGGDPGEYDELQDGNGEMVASGFRDDVLPDLVTDGRLCAEMRNALPALLDELDTLERRAIAAEGALERAIDETNEYMAPWVVEAEDVLEARAALEASRGSA